jgi:hypothetical protein
MPSLKHPSRNDVDLAIAELAECEKRRAQRAMEAYRQQQRKVIHFRGKDLLWAFAVTVGLVLLGYAAIIRVLDSVGR